MIVIVAAVPAETEIVRKQFSLIQRSEKFPDIWSASNVGPITVAHTGVGKSLAAATTALIIEKLNPATIIMIGSAGAFPASNLCIGDLAVATKEVFADEGSISPTGFLDLSSLKLQLASKNGEPIFERISLEQHLNDSVKETLGAWGKKEDVAVAFGSFATVSSCSGTDQAAEEIAKRTGALVENMEGAAAALIAHCMGVPFIELRAVSNIAEDRDFSKWDLQRANKNSQTAVLEILSQLMPRR